MRKLCLRLTLATINILAATALLAQAPADMVNTMPASAIGNYSFAAGSTFTQTFPAKVAGYPTELAVAMGSNQNPYEADVVIKVNEVEVFRHHFTDLKQRTSDWTTVFPLKGISRLVNAGEHVSFSITPDRGTSIAAAKLADPNVPMSRLGNYGDINARFYVRASAQPDTSAYSAGVVDPAIIRSTMGQGGSSYSFSAGTTFTQTFVAKGSGVPKELGVVMGSNQNLFNCHLAISVRGTKVFDKKFEGLKQRTSDWAVVFPLTEMTAHVNAGDTVSFSLTPESSIGFTAVHNDEVGISKAPLTGYGLVSSVFYMKR